MIFILRPTARPPPASSSEERRPSCVCVCTVYSLLHTQNQTFKLLRDPLVKNTIV